jgi:hypothetical protein
MKLYQKRFKHNFIYSSFFNMCWIPWKYFTNMSTKNFSYLSKLGTKICIYFCTLRAKLYIIVYIVNNFFMVILGINVESSLSSWYWGQPKNSRISANRRLTKLSHPRTQVALFRSQEQQQHGILSTTGTHFTLNPMAMMYLTYYLLTQITSYLAQIIIYTCWNSNSLRFNKITITYIKAKV